MIKAFHVTLALTLLAGVTLAATIQTTRLGVPGRANANPWVAANGQLVAVAWGASAGERKSDVFVAISRDGGVTFGQPVQVNTEAGEGRLGGEMPPRVAFVKRAAGAGASAGDVFDLVVLWTARTASTANATSANTTIKTAWSRDGGRTFSAPIALQATDAAGDRGWPSLAVDDNGRAHAIWLDHRGLAAMRAASGAHTGGHAGHRQAGATGGATMDGVAMAQHSSLYYASVDRSSSAQPERAITSGVCYCCKTSLVTGPHGAIYAAWRHVYAGNLRDMAFTMSIDGGRTFAPPSRVSEDGWEINGCPDDGPAMAVDASGTVHIVWPTVIPGPEPEGALFYASTRDGRTFTPRQRISTLGSPKPMHPTIAIDATGRIGVAWDEILKDRHVAAMRTIASTRSGPISVGPIVTLGDDPAAMYPAIAAVGDRLIAVWTSGAPGTTTSIGVQRPDLVRSAASAP